MYKELKNKVAIVTGPYGDIGNAICVKFISQGMKVALFGRDIKKLEIQKTNLLKIKKSEVIIENLDVSDSDSYKTSIENVF